MIFRRIHHRVTSGISLNYALPDVCRFRARKLEPSAVSCRPADPTVLPIVQVVSRWTKIEKR